MGFKTIMIRGGLQMDFNFKNIDIVGVISGLSTKNATMTNRHSHTFIYKIDGESLYFLRGKEVHLSPKTKKHPWGLFRGSCRRF